MKKTRDKLAVVDEGDEASDDSERRRFGEFYQSYHRLIRGVLRGMVGEASADDLNDLVQETFLRAWRGLPRFTFKSSLKTWVYRIAVNAAIDHRRKRSLSPLVLVQTELTESVTGTAAGFEFEEIGRWIQDGLDGLDEIHRGVLVLHYFEGLGIGEIAKILEIPAGTVKSRLHVGREKLKTHLREKGVGDDNW